ncbi:hypothetical protein HI914_03967 [Erysiphe necator]|nr:hypothetical protein HI914_03967 [Erysiphe necator]
MKYCPSCMTNCPSVLFDHPSEATPYEICRNCRSPLNSGWNSPLDSDSSDVEDMDFYHDGDIGMFEDDYESNNAEGDIGEECLTDEGGIYIDAFVNSAVHRKHLEMQRELQRELGIKEDEDESESEG